MKAKKPSNKRLKTATKSDQPFPIVCIGASAGGLEAFKLLIKATSEDSGMAYILVQHLDPSHDSLLPELLEKVTKIPVSEISETTDLAPDHIYVMPSNKIMVTEGGHLKLVPRPPKSKTERNLPIDTIFTSLAEVYHEHAIGVVLSGTATDGTLGLKAIKELGGITFAQDSLSAKFENMPNNAVEAGVVDFILSPEKIPEKLLEVTSFINAPAEGKKDPHLEDEDIYRKIISVLRIRKGTDFTYYKQTTIRRRILRRMLITQKTKPAEYLATLREDKDEQDALYQDFLIPVTFFFRDPEAFDNLYKKVVPQIVNNKVAGEPIRVWVAGCSTGEEAYSIAICLQEYLDKNSLKGSEYKVQIFASDISEPAIKQARTGMYSKLETSGVSEKRLSEFFTKTDGHFQVNRRIRDMCVFACHDFLKDPPFGKMDLISCRNVLIYMELYLQKKALVTFHYALNSNGFLFLGKSEATGGAPELFELIINKDKIYTRKDAPGKFMHVVSPGSERNLNQSENKESSEKMHSDFQKTADDIMLNRYMPAGVVVDEAMDIVQFRGSTSSYLEQTSGKPSHNLMVMAKHGLAFELRNVLHKVKKEKGTVKKENIPVKKGGELHNVTIEGIPLPNTIEPYYLVLFHENVSSEKQQPAGTGTKKGAKTKTDTEDLRVKQLERELVETREDMRSITEDQEAVNEELQSANEELLSGSEELQSLNEELETSKEELESTNEELVVVNNEMTSLNKQLEAEKNYSEAIVSNIREPLLVLDKHLRVRTANNAFYKLFKMSEEETEGVIVYELADKHFDIPKLRTLLEKSIPEKSKINNFEITHTFPNTGKLILLVNARVVTRESKTEELILLSIEDITKQETERRKRHDIQKQHTKDLEQKIKQRTAELSDVNKRLVLQNEELLKMNKELEAFAYVSSHDLQEPLRKIQIFVDRILDKEHKNLSTKGISYFNFIQDAAHRMQKLIEDLLTFSRLAKAEKKFKPTDLNTVVDKAKADFRDILEEKNATIETDELCEVNVVEFQFQQLINNLVSNALKFARPGTPPVIKITSNISLGSTLKQKNLVPDKKYCHITFSDNGIGFEKKFGEIIFEVFKKLHSKDEFPGTGIGLATVKKVVDNHNGIITATSKLDKGTTFEIYIPVESNILK
ncbi:CheR family methyltransferase [Natronogracilivirga saccharolytica]|uniref:histidine kinase n=1 Tax=Natronogracilivirga saccharolytica TaxID=2812953 RepID=A0A8J7S763_9BACT|nr:CheR family methyltransferase [Natronogracilivirga saccharolytica]MBP3193213.1 PAS domain-containing protein [Natronogracilivirga saccharolytica]